MKLFYILLYEFVLITALRINKDNKKSNDPLADLSDAELEKMMKDYGIATSELDKSGNKDKKDDPLNMLEPKTPSTIEDVIKLNKEALKKFQITSKNAFDLLNILKDNKIFARLPVSAQNIVADSITKKSYLDINKSQKNKNDNMNILISNTLNSQVILDHDNRMGRKGMLTLVNKDTAEVIQTWAI
jgi:hypothetical protein